MKRFDSHKTLLVKVIVAAAVTAIIFTTLAYALYIRYTEKMSNTFDPAYSTDPVINETFNKYLKENVYFNVGVTEYPVYVRAKIVVTWQKKNPDYDPNDDPPSDEYLTDFKTPEEGAGKDYEIKFANLSTGGSLMSGKSEWVYRAEDGYYYFTAPVSSGESTDVLIDSCKQLKDGPDGYALNVNIIVQTVQAVGYTDGYDGTGDAEQYKAWRDAWGIYETSPAETKT